MNFLRKLFSSKEKVEIDSTPLTVKEIYSEEYFEDRYKEDNINPEILSDCLNMTEDCLKMIQSYYIENKIEKKIEAQVNHPLNLDLIDQDSVGFIFYYNSLKLEREQAILFIAYSFSDYLINKYGFKLYKDTKPEYPLRGMTLKYNKDGVVLSVYPYEYATKVFNEDKSFSELDEKIALQINEVPKASEIIQKIINSTDKKG